MKNIVTLLFCAALVAVPAFSDSDKKGTPPGQSKHGTPPGHSKQDGVPPGLAKKGGLPPGIAKKFGARPPSAAYIAIDPRYFDRAWFLIGNKWQLKSDFDLPLRLEIRDSLKLKPVPPPVPLPKLADPLHVVLFK